MSCNKDLLGKEEERREQKRRRQSEPWNISVSDKSSKDTEMKSEVAEPRLTLLSKVTVTITLQALSNITKQRLNLGS